MEGILLGISEIKWKKPRGSQDVVAYRYLALLNNDAQRYLIRMTDYNFQTLPVDKDGELRTPKSGDMVSVEHFYEGKFILDDGTKMIFNPDIFTILDHVKKRSTQRYTLEGMYFFDWGVVLRNDMSKCVIDKNNWDKLTGLETSSLLWKLKKRLKEKERKEAFVEIDAMFLVYFGWDINREWLYHKSSEFEWAITQKNLLPMKKIVIEEKEAKKISFLLADIKQFLQQRLFLPWEDILALARKYTIPEDEVEHYAKAATWKKNYDADFSEYLKERATKVLYGFDGLFFVMKGGLTILEEPEPNKATYIFIGEPNFVASRIEAIKRENFNSRQHQFWTEVSWREILYRLKKANPEKMGWFVGRVVHYDKDQWKRDLDSLLEETHS